MGYTLKVDDTLKWTMFSKLVISQNGRYTKIRDILEMRDTLEQAIYSKWATH
jgi:hypothetical protein